MTNSYDGAKINQISSPNFEKDLLYFLVDGFQKEKTAPVNQNFASSKKD